MSYDPGDVWTPGLEVRNSSGTLTAATVTVTVTSPSGAVTNPSVSSTATGVYVAASTLLTEPGQWAAKWSVSGAVTGVETQHAYVRALGSNVISLADVKARLNKGLTVDDDELRDMLDAALAEYREWVGPVGTKTLRYDGGRETLILPLDATITSVAYADGTTVNLADLDFDDGSGLLHWAHGTSGWFAYGRRNVLVTVNVTLPAHHREAILADVAGYFAATQRGGTVGALPDNGYQSGYEERSTPIVLFPRIRALAASYPSIA